MTINMQRVISLLALVVSTLASSSFDCSRVLTDIKSDDKILTLMNATDDQSFFTVDCLENLVAGSHFKTINHALDNDFNNLNSKQDPHELYRAIKRGAESVNGRFNKLQQLHTELKKRPVHMTPPFTWYQSLNQVVIEIKFAYRHDVSGCATLFNDTIAVRDDKFYVSASCAEEQDNNMFYELSFPFWAPVNSTSLKWDKIPVGKYRFTIDKLNKPARWRHLYDEDSPRPSTMKIDLEKLQANHYQLYEFEDDEIEDFEGHDLVEVPDEVDADDMTWLFPNRGPGKFKNLRKKKGKKKGKKGKKKAKK